MCMIAKKSSGRLYPYVEVWTSHTSLYGAFTCRASTIIPASYWKGKCSESGGERKVAEFSIPEGDGESLF